jgi:hypothetical protein
MGWAYLVAGAAVALVLAIPILITSLQTDQEPLTTATTDPTALPVPEGRDRLDLDEYPLVFDGPSQSLSGSGWASGSDVVASLEYEGTVETRRATTDDAGRFVTPPFDRCCADVSVLTVSIGDETTTARIDRGIYVGRLDAERDVMTLVFGQDADVEVYIEGAGSAYRTSVTPQSDWWSLDLSGAVDVVDGMTATAVLIRDGVAFVSPPKTTEPGLNVTLDLGDQNLEGEGFLPNQPFELAFNEQRLRGVGTDDGGHFVIEFPEHGIEVRPGDVMLLSHPDGLVETAIPNITIDSFDASTGRVSGSAPGLDLLESMVIHVSNAEGVDTEESLSPIPVDAAGTWTAQFRPLNEGERVVGSWVTVRDSYLQIATAFGALPPVDSGDGADPVLNPATGHYYLAVFVPEGLAWNQAQTAAEASSYEGTTGHLATITSADESEFVVESFPQAVASAPNHNPYWLGGFQPVGATEPAEGWQWVTEEPFDYQNWAPGEPNNASAPEQCLHFTHDGASLGQWNDQPCDDVTTRGYVVEYDVGN